MFLLPLGLTVAMGLDVGLPVDDCMEASVSSKCDSKTCLAPDIPVLWGHHCYPLLSMLSSSYWLSLENPDVDWGQGT